MTESFELQPDVARHLRVFQRGAVDLIEEQALTGLLSSSLSQGRPLRIKFGMDPSSPDLHIGHAIPLMKLRDLQRLGHQIVLIIGDATAMVGDPSGRSKLRPVLSREQVEANLQTYLEQAQRVLDMSATEVRRNSEWFDELGCEGLLDLATRMTVAQMIERDTFRRRLAASEPIGINEFLYPLMQGWDSVRVQADVELGGTDQLFNLGVGRRLQEQAGQPPQIIRTHPLINGIDGRKMSKSYDNAIALTDTARKMTFDVMRLDDGSMRVWFTQLTHVEDDELETLLGGHPRQAKARLAHEITAFFHGAEAADEAAAAFDREVRDRELPETVPEVAWDPVWGDELMLANLLKNTGLVQTTSEARRTIQQGGVRLDDHVVGDPKARVARPSEPVLLRVGKKRFRRLLP